MTRIIGHYSYNQNVHRCTDFIVEKYLFSFLVRQRIVVWGEGCVGGRILVRELVSNPMNRTCLVGTLASPLSTCINALVSVRLHIYSLFHNMWVGCSTGGQRGNAFRFIWIRSAAGLTISWNVCRENIVL